MREGKYKTNIKPPYFQCTKCGYHGPDYDFKHGIWWWEKFYCPKCKSQDIKNYVKKAPPPPSPQQYYQRIEDKEILEFIYNRMLNVHLENPRYDYMLKFKKIIDRK
jgi:hypothetical protein